MQVGNDKPVTTNFGLIAVTPANAVEQIMVVSPRIKALFSRICSFLEEFA
jgi:hypothetical protein